MAGAWCKEHSGADGSGCRVPHLPTLAREIISPFVADCIPDADLRAILDQTYAEFRHDAVAPLVQIDSNQWMLELFHGPTLAFKDFALQLLGRLLDYVLERKQQKVVIMGATSGDTGSAAIEGCKRCNNIDIFILHPHQRVSDVQRKQMTTVVGDNIHNLAVQGNFDDCQAMVKASFADRAFLPALARVPSGMRIPAMPVFHPAFLLREPRQKRLAWSDLQSLAKALKDD